MQACTCAKNEPFRKALAIRKKIYFLGDVSKSLEILAYQVFRASSDFLWNDEDDDEEEEERNRFSFNPNNVSDSNNNFISNQSKFPESWNKFIKFIR